MNIDQIRKLAVEESYYVESVDALTSEISFFLEYTEPNYVSSGKFLNFELNKETKLKILRSLIVLKSDANKHEPLLERITDYLESVYRVEIGSYGSTRVPNIYDPLDQLVESVKAIAEILYDLEEYTDRFRDIALLKPYLFGFEHLIYIRTRLKGIVILLNNIQCEVRAVKVEG